MVKQRAKQSAADTSRAAAPKSPLILARGHEQCRCCEVDGAFNPRCVFCAARYIALAKRGPGSQQERSARCRDMLNRAIAHWPEPEANQREAWIRRLAQEADPRDATHAKILMIDA